MKYGKGVLLPGTLTVIILILLLTKEDDSTSFELISEIPTETTIAQPEESPAVEAATTTIYVDVKGAVNNPGVYPFTSEDRITDAIQQAGGYTSDANPQLINHAQKLQDEMAIYIPKQGEAMPEMIATPASVTDTTSASVKVNINQADETVLTTLPGIGPSKASAILGYRDEHGPFQSIEGLKEVTGIGEKTFEQLQDLIDIK